MDTEELTTTNNDGIIMPKTEESAKTADTSNQINAENQQEEDTVTFEDLGLDEYTLKAVQKKGFVTPSPIQALAIPRLLTGDANLIARARTGTGKTAAFGLPIIQSIREKSDNIQALVLEPTRELAVQTCEELKSFANNEFPRTTVLYGGASYAQQIRELKRGCEIVVGTPGRIKDHLERKTLDLSKIKYFILDEGDEMLDMGFIDDIREIFSKSNIEARILLFSATMPAPILKIAADFMGEYDIIEEEKVIDEALLIEQKYWMVKESDKIEALVRLIDMSPDFYGLVFTMTKMDADRVTRELDIRGYEAAALHGDIMQNQREKVLERFRMKKTRILVATDVAARGIDISGLSHVVNYSLPFDTATYVHRIGRTGRAGTTGTAITFVKPEERRKLSYFLKNTERATKSRLIEEKIPTINEVLTVKENRAMDDLESKLFKLVRTEETNENAVPEVNTTAEINTDISAENTTAEGRTNNSTETSPVAENAVSEETSQTAGTGNTAPEKVLNEVPEKYLGMAQKLCEGQDAQKVLAGVLSILYGEKLSPKHYGRISTKDSGSSGNQTRIFISLGKKDGYRAREIADYFSTLLNIPGRMVDDIDVAQQFSLVSLPTASAKKAVEMSKSNKKLPHMHIDMKEEGRGSRKPPRDRDNFKKDNAAKGDSSARNDQNGKRNEGVKKERRSEGRAKGSRPNPHTQGVRSSSKKISNASAFVKKSSSSKAERF